MSSLQIDFKRGAVDFALFYFVSVLEEGFCYVAQASLELRDSGNPPASASKVLELQAFTTMPSNQISFLI
jgi:hypothetical protein